MKIFNSMISIVILQTGLMPTCDLFCIMSSTQSYLSDENLCRPVGSGVVSFPSPIPCQCQTLSVPLVSGVGVTPLPCPLSDPHCPGGRQKVGSLHTCQQ